MPQSEAFDPKPPADIRRELRHWHLQSMTYIILMVLVLVFAYACGWFGLAFLNSGFGTEDSYLYLSLIAGVIAFGLWVAARRTEKRLMDSAQQRQGDHGFYGRFLESKRILERS